MAAVLQTLRYIAPYEGGTDYAFERRFKSALSLMFCRYSVAFIEFVHSGHPFPYRLTQLSFRGPDYASERSLPQERLPTIIIGMYSIPSISPSAVLTLSY